MNIFSAIKKQQCIKEYQSALTAQDYPFVQWAATQPEFVMQEKYAHGAILYADYICTEGHDGIQAGTPVFLPDFSPNRWDYEDYLGEAVFVRKDLYAAVDWDNTSRRAGLKRVIEEAKAQDVDCEAVLHIRGLVKEAPAGFVKLNKKQGIGHFESVSKGRLEEAVKEGISVIIPSKDHPEILQKCLLSLEKTTGKMPLEIIVVDNGSCRQNKALVTSLCKKIEEISEGRMTCRYLYEPMEFHFSKMCNKGAKAATGEYVLFLNDDIEAVETGWLSDMLAEAVKPYTGAVGMKLLYPDGKRIQHAGIVNLPMGPVHKLQFAADEAIYYDGRNRGVHNVSAVTGACLMMRKDLFVKLDGMSEELPVAFNDVELCFHAMEQGYYNVICCNHYLLHHESISRGQDNTEEKRSRLLRERSKLYTMHPAQVSKDPFYPYDVETGYGLCHAYLDTDIHPAFEDGLPLVQEVSKAVQNRDGKNLTRIAADRHSGEISTELLREIDSKEENKYFSQKAEHVKLNPCLKVEIEQLYQDAQDNIHVAGYSFVIGSDNSHFAYTLLLRGEDKIYAVDLKPMRRKDLERNMPDQVNVGLAGFHVKIQAGDITEGKYRIEVYAKDRTSGLRLRQGSNVCVRRDNV